MTDSLDAGRRHIRREAIVNLGDDVGQPAITEHAHSMVWTEPFPKTLVLFAPSGQLGENLQRKNNKLNRNG